MIDPEGQISSIVSLSEKDARELYSKLRNERERTTFSMMMKMNPKALTLIRKEFFMREDSVNLQEFIYIIQKHLSAGASEDDKISTQSDREFAFNMCELFKEVDVNGDCLLDWQVLSLVVVQLLLQSVFSYFRC